jgi:hypothetical protein
VSQIHDIRVVPPVCGLSEDADLPAAVVRGGAATAGRPSERAFVDALVGEPEGAVAAGAIR